MSSWVCIRERLAHGVGNEACEVLAVEVGGEGERLVPEAETPVSGAGELVGGLGVGGGAECSVVAAVFTIERRLAIDAGSQAEEHVLLQFGLVADAGTGTKHPARAEADGGIFRFKGTAIGMAAKAKEDIDVAAAAGVEVQFSLHMSRPAEGLHGIGAVGVELKDGAYGIVGAVS